jgi:class 3 adenylate cyclase/tetratricopeptide (TPR) repeat protein
MAGALRMPAETRKTVTVLFTDVTGSTALGERLDTEPLSRVMARFFDTVRGVLERHGGTVQKFIGDAVMAVFGIPVVHEDDALRAVRAASELGAGLAELNGELERDWGVVLQVRTGVNTGEVMAGNPGIDTALVVGDTVNVAARLQQTAAPGEVVLGQATWRLVRDAVEAEPLAPLAVKGKRGQLSAYRLRAVRPETPGQGRRPRAPLVGRHEERALIESAYGRVAAGRGCHSLTVLGLAGVGKTRLVSEALAAHAGQAAVLSGRCLPYGEGITVWPIAEMVRRAAQVNDTDTAEGARAKLDALLAGAEQPDLLARRIAQLIGLVPSAAPAEEAAWAVRLLLEHLARDRPLIAVFDDLHWAEPTLLDLIEHVVDWSRDVPLLVVSVARPELLEHRPTWADGKRNATSILLEPLDRADSHLLLERQLGTGPVDEAVGARLVEAAGGNPLFLEELLAMLVEDGQLRQQDGRWVVTDRLTVRIPPTIQALLAARLDRLDAEQRMVLARASVVGEQFEQAAVVALSPAEHRATVPASLAALVDKQLLRPVDPRSPGEEAFQFRHLLIRDAAYAAIPKQARVELHERFAGWLETATVARAREYGEIVGYHLEQAYQYRTALGPVDDHARQVAVRAADRLATAGQRVLDGADMPAAVNLLARAVALRTERDPARLALLPDLARALTETGELTQAQALLSEATEGADALGDRRIGAYAILERLRLGANLAVAGWAEEARREVERLVPVFEELGDDHGLARSWGLLGMTLRLWCQVEGSEEARQRAVAYARRAGDEREAAVNLGAFALAALDGPVPVPDGVRRCERILAESGGQRRVEGQALLALGGLRAMEGDLAGARRLLARSRSIFDELGMRLLVAELLRVSGQVELLAGDPVAAGRELRSGYETLEGMGEQSNRCLLAALLAHTLYAQGHGEEAAGYLQASEDDIAFDDFAARIAWGSARSRLLAGQGKVREGERLARMVVELARETDAIGLRGGALLNLAAVIRLAGRPADAAPLVEEARALYQRKGNVVLARQAAAILAELAGGQAPA